MSEPSQRLVTAAELYALPDQDGKLELIGGVLYETSAAAVRHIRVQMTLGRSLGGPFDQDDDGPGGWWILSEAGVELGPYDVPEPDLAGWRRERLPMLPDDGTPIRIAPDWVCEVLSPSTARRDRTLKTELYAAHGVGHMWIIDPILRTIEAYRNQDGHWLRLGSWTDGDRAAIAPFEAVTLDVTRLFLPKGPDTVAEGEPAPWSP